jgi:PIN domain nuclease of toxin-antitoxin system
VAGELLDTHVLVRWLGDTRRLSKEQARILTDIELRRQPFQISAMTLIELGQMFRYGAVRMPVDPRVVLEELESTEKYRILPITVAIAQEFGTLFPLLRDPVDTAIAATARVHGLRLMTSDSRIIDSRLVPVID